MPHFHTNRPTPARLRNALVIGSLTLLALPTYAETVDRSNAADPNGEVEIINVAGSVRVSGWDKNEVHVHTELSNNAQRLEFTRDGDHTLIKVVSPTGTWHGGDSELTVDVPQNSRIHINTVSALQAVSGVRGSQRLQSVSGDIDTAAYSADLQAKSVSGSINVRGQASPPAGRTQARVSTVSGEIHVQNAASEYEVESVSGSIDVKSMQLSRAHIKTTNGELNFTGSLLADARFEAETINGALSATLVGKVNAQFDIETFNGSIDNCFGPKAKRTNQFAPGKELMFKEGAGQAHVRLQTLNGGIDLCRK